MFSTEYNKKRVMHLSITLLLKPLIGARVGHHRGLILMQGKQDHVTIWIILLSMFNHSGMGDQSRRNRCSTPPVSLPTKNGILKLLTKSILSSIIIINACFFIVYDIKWTWYGGQSNVILINCLFLFRFIIHKVGAK